MITAAARSTARSAWSFEKGVVVDTAKRDPIYAKEEKHGGRNEE
jgi:hypothetical protein